MIIFIKGSEEKLQPEAELLSKIYNLEIVGEIQSLTEIRKNGIYTAVEIKESEFEIYKKVDSYILI